MKNGDIVVSRKFVTGLAGGFPAGELFFVDDIEKGNNFVTVDGITTIGCMVGVPKSFLRVSAVRSFLHRRGIKTYKIMTITERDGK